MTLDKTERPDIVALRSYFEERGECLAHIATGATMTYQYSAEKIAEGLAEQGWAIVRGSEEEGILEYIGLWGKALRERDEARDTACRLEEELARRPPL